MSATAAFAASSSQTPLTTPRLRRLHPFPTSDHRPKAATSAPRYVRFRASPAASWKAVRWRIGVFSSGEGIAGMQQRDLPGEVSFDSLLAAAELFFMMPPSICSIGCVIGFLIPGVSRSFQVNLGSRFFVWQFFFLVGAVAVGGLIRRRQWQRLCRENDSGAGVDLIARIEKVEEDLRSSVTIVRVLSRQLEKLGIKFRVTRKALKEPISETAALAQKNSEATRALAMQEDNLEKELGEIQKVLLAMQEQQQKQLELILAIGKAGRLFEGKQDGAATEQGPVGRSNPIPQKKQGKQVEIQAGMHSDNDRA